ncbi:HAD-IA family hydrolase [Candidatus Fermentibacteria bacterium]|nr:HAD-IA family hydrolase [Candidatus Fermentibacteria bacterium]
MRAYSSVLLDLDGTLLDYPGAQAAAVRETSRLMAIPEDLFGDLMTFVNSPPVQAFESCRPGAPALGDDAVAKAFPAVPSIQPAAFLTSYFKALSKRGDTIEGAHACLKSLRRGRKLAAVSNGLGHVQRSRLEVSGLTGFFDALVISCEVGVAKPDPGIFRMALDLLGAGPGDAVMIGDSVSSDMAGAEAAGMDFIFVSATGEVRTAGRTVAVVGSISEIPELECFR